MNDLRTYVRTYVRMQLFLFSYLLILVRRHRRERGLREDECCCRRLVDQPRQALGIVCKRKRDNDLYA